MKSDDFEEQQLNEITIEQILPNLLITRMSLYLDMLSLFSLRLSSTTMRDATQATFLYWGLNGITQFFLRGSGLPWRNLEKLNLLVNAIDEIFKINPEKLYGINIHKKTNSRNKSYAALQSVEKNHLEHLKEYVNNPLALFALTYFYIALKGDKNTALTYANKLIKDHDNWSGKMLTLHPPEKLPHQDEDAELIQYKACVAHFYPEARENTLTKIAKTIQYSFLDNREARRGVVVGSTTINFPVLGDVRKGFKTVFYRLQWLHLMRKLPIDTLLRVVDDHELIESIMRSTYLPNSFCHIHDLNEFFSLPTAKIKNYMRNAKAVRQLRYDAPWLPIEKILALPDKQFKYHIHSDTMDYLGTLTSLDEYNAGWNKKNGMLYAGYLVRKNFPDIPLFNILAGECVALFITLWKELQLKEQGRLSCQYVMLGIELFQNKTWCTNVSKHFAINNNEKFQLDPILKFRFSEFTLCGFLRGFRC